MVGRAAYMRHALIDPKVVGHGILPGGHIEIELDTGFERNTDVKLSKNMVMVVTGAPQQGFRGSVTSH